LSAGSDNNVIQGNSIIGNSDNGIYLVESLNNLVGGTTSGAGNTIASNGAAGIAVGHSGYGPTTGNSFLGNSIHDNGGLGIYLNSATHANDDQAAPVLTTATSSGTSTTISGTLASVASTTFRIEFFSNHGLDTSGNAEGLTYLGFTTVTTDNNGNASFTATNLAAIPAGQGYLTATATNQSTGDTSQFSNYLTAPTSTVLTSSANPSLLNQSVTFTATVSSSFGTPTGSVDFVDTTTNTDLGTVALSANGTASVMVSNLALGSQVIKATFAAQSFFLGSSGTLTQQVDYKFSGFLPPLSNGLTFAVNRTIPIKFSLSDANGNAISSLSAVTSLQIQALDANGHPVGNPFNPSSTNNQGLQYSGGQYQFNWQTKGLAAGSYEIVLKLADGTTQTKTITLTAGGSSAGLVTGSGGAASAGALLGGEVDLYVDNGNGDLTADELARIQDAVNAIDSTITPYGVVINAVSDPTQANVTLNMAATSALGGLAQGVLGCTTDADQVTMIQGWSWYAGSDPTQIGAGQYDFETAVMHELGHVLGLGHSSTATSVMYANLAPGTTDRTLTTADLNVSDNDHGGPCALQAALATPVSDPSLTPASGVSLPSSSDPLSAVDPLLSSAELTRLLSGLLHAYQAELSSWLALWQQADALFVQRFDALLSMGNGALKKDMPWLDALR
jgi:parallel beta-helix repeat protein